MFLVKGVHDMDHLGGGGVPLGGGGAEKKFKLKSTEIGFPAF